MGKPALSGDIPKGRFSVAYSLPRALALECEPFELGIVVHGELSALASDAALFQPPQGAVVELRYVRSLMCTMPASIFMPSSMARSRSCVSTAAGEAEQVVVALGKRFVGILHGNDVVTGAKLSS